MNLKINVGGRAVLLIFLAAVGLNALAVPPKVVKSVPENGAQDVDPAIKNIRIGFDQDMGKGCSICGDESDPSYPKMGQAKWVSPRLFVIPVALEGDHVYRFWLNSQSFKNFRSASGESLEPVEFSFKTKAATAGEKTDGDEEETAGPPKIVETVPKNGADDVDPNLTEIRITFDKDMGKDYSVCGNPDDPTYPKTTGKAGWESARVFVMSVRLKPDQVYQFWLNSQSYRNFQSASGEPLEPLEFSFVTAPAGSKKQGPSSVKPSGSTRSELPDTGEKLQFSLPDVYGRIVTSQDYKGVPVFLEFGACW